MIVTFEIATDPGWDGVVEWARRSVCDASIFWVMVTAIGTLLLAWIAFEQLGGLADTSRADFVFRLKSEFFNVKSRRLIFLIEEDMLEFVPEGESGYFIIKNYSSERVRERISHLGFDGPSRAQSLRCGWLQAALSARNDPTSRPEISMWACCFSSRRRTAGARDCFASAL